jgi:probable F420-dependent oxidoreductase
MGASAGPSIGIHVTLTDQSVALAELASAMEERGLDAIYLSEHTHIPVHYDRSFYPEAGGMPERYKRVLDPYVAMSFIAARYRLEVGTCVALVANHDPLALAKTIASLDFLSGGRLFVGIGFGWCPDEYATHNQAPPPGQRAELVRETVELMKAVWTEEVATFQGRYLNLPPVWSWPKPVSKPHPPILLGAKPTNANFKRLSDWADGWITMETFPLDPAFPATMQRLRDHWNAAGRDPGSLQVLALSYSLDPSRIRESVDQCRSEGVQRFAIHIGETEGRDLARLLDELGETRASSRLSRLDA